MSDNTRGRLVEDGQKVCLHAVLYEFMWRFPLKQNHQKTKKKPLKRREGKYFGEILAHELRRSKVRFVDNMARVIVFFI